MAPLRLVLPLALVPSCAWAEVCDKVAGESWLPDHGPIDVPNWWRLLAVVALALVVARLFRSRTVAWGAAAVSTLAALFNWAAAIWPDDNIVTRAAIREGCISPEHAFNALTAAIAFSVVTAIYVVAAKSGFLVPRTAHSNGT
jgi:hypothetical protein